MKAICSGCLEEFDVLDPPPKNWFCHKCGETIIITSAGYFVGGIRLDPEGIKK